MAGGSDVMRMISHASSKSDDANAFGKDKTILRYYYFLLYLPLTIMKVS